MAYEGENVFDRAVVGVEVLFDVFVQSGDA